ncbi:organic radical activating enzyme [Edwardsiella phage vB_EpM_ZHS]|jgi:organic radical activating enzyme|nr:organic radical activating enzyme [Edwardsiella phage vB_EpM_ZHS]
MFGKNPIRPILRDPLNLAVEDIFYTIQGEGPQAGRPALFIRLAGCNLACHFCDTQFEGRADMPETVPALMERIERDFSVKQRELVVITGGEPMRQDWSWLAEKLIRSGTKLIQVETAGTLWQEGLEDFIADASMQLVCSPKTPKVHPEVARWCGQWKYIIRGGEVDLVDGLPNRGTQVATAGKESRIYRPWDHGGFPTTDYGTIWLSPCDDYDETLNKVNLELARDLCLKHGYRLSLQMHKLIGVA